MHVTVLHNNGSVASNIRKWVQGEMLAESTVPMPKKPRYTSLRSATMDIEFVGPGTSFPRRMPRNLSGVNLYRYAFQGMRGQHTVFDLRHNGQLVSPSQETIEQQGLEHRSAVHITLNADLDRTSRPELEPGTDGSDSEREKLTLIKVYGRRESEIFSYWVPGSENITSENLIFRYWRYRAELGSGFQDYDIDIWNEIRAGGDRKYTGNITNPWDRIDPSLSPTYGKGVLGKEMLYYESGEAREETHLGLSHRDILVIKLHVLPHAYQKILARKASKKAKTMSRVSTSPFLQLFQVP